MCEKIANEHTGDADTNIPVWQQDILKNCRLWLSNLPEMNDKSSDEKDEPDLYSFFEQLSVLKSDFRKNSRRSHETFNRFGEHLDEFQGVLDSLMQRIETLSQNRGSTEILARQGLLLQMVELYERLSLFERKLQEMAASSSATKQSFCEKLRRLFTGKGQDSASAITANIHEGFSLILFHFEGFLTKEGVSRIQAVGTLFDPSFMIAVGTVATADMPPNTVYEEISSGYLYGDHLLKLAKVTVTKGKEL